MANPLLSSLADPFTAAALNTAVWNTTSTGVSIVAPGRVGIPVSASFNTLGAAPYDATGQAIYARVTPATAGTGGKAVLTLFRLVLDSNNYAQFSVTPGTSFLAQVITAGATVSTTLPAYDPAGHAWWRIRETGGSFEFAVSADGYAWTVLATMAHSWAATALTFAIQAGTTDGTTGSSAYVEYLNTMTGAAGKLPSWPQVRFQVAFNQGANTSGQPSFVDLSSRIRQSWTAEQSGRQYELDQVQSGQLTMTLWNLDGALDPLNGSSPYSPNVLPMRPCRLQAVWPPTRNLIPAPYANGTAPAAQWYPWYGTVTAATGLAPAPTGHTTAASWQFPITASSANGYPLLTGTSASGADASAFPVSPGQSYTVSVWASRASGGDASLSTNPKLLFYDQNGAQVGSSTNTSVAVPVVPAWSRLSVTATAPATAVSARFSYWLTNTSTTAVNTLYLTAMQLEQSASLSPWTPGGTVYPLWAGFVERWPQQWDQQGTYGLVDITCVDALAALAQFTLQPSFQASLMALNPTFLYPFNEPAGSTSFADATGHKGPRGIGTSYLGGGSASVTAGSSIQGTGSVGASGPVVTITNSPAGSGTNTTGRFISSATNTYPPTSGGWTRVICFRTTATAASGQYQTLWAHTGPGFWYGGGSQAVFTLGIDANNHGFGWISNAAATANSLVPVPDVVCNDGNWHIMVVQLSADGKTWTVAVDNHGYQSTTTLDYHPTGLVTNGIGATEYRSDQGFQQAFSGDIAFATEFPTAIGNPVAYDLGTGFSLGWAGETSAARAQRILNLAGYQGKLSTLDATSAMGGANLDQVDAMSALQLVGDTEAGQVYVDGAGVLWLASRTWRYLQNSPVVTFGENAGEVPYLGDVEVELDDTHIYNDVVVINQPLPGASQQPGAHTTDANSQAAYLPRSLQRTINVQDGTVPQAAAQYLVSQYAQPLARVGTLTVDPASNPALWSPVLPIGFGTRAQVSRRPPATGGAAAITVQQFIEAITWNGDDKGNLKLSLELSPAGPYLGWWVVSSLHTTVHTASTAGTATVTLDPLTGSAANPAGAVLTKGTQLTLGYGTANAETLTVQSVAATVAGYTSVAVTFTANTAHNHAVSEVVCQPLPANYLLPTAVQAGFPASLDAAATLSATTPRVAY